MANHSLIFITTSSDPEQESKKSGGALVTTPLSYCPSFYYSRHSTYSVNSKNYIASILMNKISWRKFNLSDIDNGALSLFRCS